MFTRHPGRLLNVLCTFNLRPVSTRDTYLKCQVADFKLKILILRNAYFSRKPGKTFSSSWEIFILAEMVKFPEALTQRCSVKKAFLKIL